MKTLSLMKSSLALSALAFTAAFPQQALAITFDYLWTGNAGYSASGAFGYDETTAPTILSESGAGPTNYLNFLNVSFFDPSNNRLQSFDTVDAGVSQSPFFKFNFDTSTHTLFGAFDVGGGTFVIGEQFLQGTIGSLLELKQDIDQMGASVVLDQNSGEITVSERTSVPEPTTLSLGLLGLGLLGLGLTGKRAVS